MKEDIFYQRVMDLENEFKALLEHLNLDVGIFKAGKTGATGTPFHYEVKIVPTGESSKRRGKKDE